MTMRFLFWSFNAQRMSSKTHSETADGEGIINDVLIRRGEAEKCGCERVRQHSDGK